MPVFSSGGWSPSGNGGTKIALDDIMDAVFSADAAGRAKFADDFINAALLAHNIDASGIGFKSAISKRIVADFTAGVDLSANQVVYISAANQVSPALLANASQTIGVTDEAATAGNSVDVTTFGKTNVVANSAITAGSLLIASGVFAGRVTALVGHKHTNPNTASGGSHTHANSTSDNAGAHTHTNPDTGGPSSTLTIIVELYTGTACASGYCITGAGTNSAASPSHTHTQGDTSSAGDHFHTIWDTDSAGDHFHTQDDTGLASNGVVVGKAITAAAGAGDTIEVYICLAG